MLNSWLRLPLLFILLVLLQVWLFNQIHLFGVATPLLYVYFIVKLPENMNRSLVLLLSALLGFTIDLLTLTFGVNMLATTVVGFLRFYLLKLFAPRFVFVSYTPSFSTLGKTMFTRYAFLLVLIHHVVLFITESFSFFDPLMLTLRIAGSFVLTALLLIAFESVGGEGRKRGDE